MACVSTAGRVTTCVAMSGATITAVNILMKAVEMQDARARDLWKALHVGWSIARSLRLS